MLNIHWNWIAFIVIIVIFIAGIWKTAKDEGGGEYGIGLFTPLLLLALIAFILIWGGIFWW